jgi:hypothetical protein
MFVTSACKQSRAVAPLPRSSTSTPIHTHPQCFASIRSVYSGALSEEGFPGGYARVTIHLTAVGAAVTAVRQPHSPLAPPTPGPCGRPAHTNHVHIQLHVQCLYLTCLSEVGLYRTATLPAENATRPAAEPRPLPESTLLPMTRSSRMTDCMGEVHSVHDETFNTSRVLGVYR